MFSTDMREERSRCEKGEEKKGGVRKEGRRKEEEKRRKGTKSHSDLRLSASSLWRSVS